MNIKRIFSIKTNFILRNIKEFVFQRKYEINRVDDRPICFYLDAATYNNLGDQAIAFATELFLDDEFGKEHVRVVNESDLIGYIKSLRKQIKDNDIIVLGGGGNMGDLYPRYESLRRLVVKSFPDNKIIIFPQTIDYSKDKYGQRELEKAKKVYGSHENLTLCARENNTYEILKSFCRKVILVPDIVFYLVGKLQLEYTRELDCGLCLREDREAALRSEEKSEIESNLKKQNLSFEKLTTSSLTQDYIKSFDEREKAIIQKLNEFGKYKYIITDRLHGMIFSILSGTPCVAIDNSNHKVFGVYDIIKNRFTEKPFEVCDIENVVSDHIKHIAINECEISETNLFGELRQAIIEN